MLADEKTQLKELLDVIDTKLATNRADSDEWTAFGIELQIRKEDADDLGMHLGVPQQPLYHRQCVAGVDRKWLLKRVRGLQQRVERSWRPTRKTALVRCYDAKAGIYAYTDPDSVRHLRFVPNQCSSSPTSARLLFGCRARKR